MTWWGHATVDVRLDGIRLLTDPLLRARVGPLRSQGHRPRTAASSRPGEPGGPGLAGVDAVLLSHLHRDHTDLPSLRRFTRQTRVLAPAGAGRVVRRSVQGSVEEVASGATTEIGPVRVTATPAEHDGRRDRRGPWAEAVGYLVKGSSTVYFAGDTDLFDGMADLAGDDGIDVALLPVSGWGLTLGDGHMGRRGRRGGRAAAATAGRPGPLGDVAHPGRLAGPPQSPARRRRPVRRARRAAHARHDRRRARARPAHLGPGTDRGPRPVSPREGGRVPGCARCGGCSSSGWSPP